MGLKKLKSKDKKKRFNIELFENKQQFLKCLKKNKKLKSAWWSRHKLSSLIFRRIRNRCIITGRGKSVVRYFKISRIELSRWIKNKKLPGIELASW